MNAKQKILFVALTGLAIGVVLLPMRTLAQQIAPVFALSTVAGKGTVGDTGDGGQATNATMDDPHGVAIDKAGNIYFSEATDVVRKVTPSGVISTVAGTAGKTGYSGDGGPATSALLNGALGVEIDADQNLLIADVGNSVIRKVNAVTGIITTVAGTAGKTGYTGDGGLATSATFHTPYTAAGDSAGNIYIADYGNHVIRKVDTSGNISTFAGTGTLGNTGDGGPAINAELDEPFSVWLDPAGNLYINDLGVSVTRMIDTAGIIHTIAGNGTKGSTGDGGLATSAEFSTQHGVVIDGLGNTYIADEGNQAVRMINASGILSIVAGTLGSSGGTTGTGDGGPALSGKFSYPYGLAIDASNNLYVPDGTGNRIRKLSLNTALPSTAVATSATQNLFVASNEAVTPSTATLTPSSEFALGTPSGCSLGTQLAANTACTVPITFTPTAAGLQTAQLAFTDTSGNVSVIGLSGVGTAPQVVFSPADISTVAGNGSAGYSGATGQASAAQVSTPRGGVVDSAGNIYFADSGNNVIRRIDAISGAISTVAGSGTAGYAGDGSAATSAQLNAPAKVVLDAAGNLYIADTGNSVIRFVDATTGLISTIAGTGTASYTGDAGAATAATLNRPQGLAVDLGEHVYVADTGNNAIRYFGKGGQISTFVGNGTAGYSGDGGNAHGAELNAPQTVVLDQSGDVYIADTGNDVVRMISATNQISTIAGQQGNSVNAGDGGAATAATLNQPSDVALDAAGDIYIAAGGQVRLVNMSGIISTIVGTGTSGSYGGEGGASTDATLGSTSLNIMLDGSANLYISDTTANRILEDAAAAAPSLTFSKQAPGSIGSSQVISVLNVGNSPLILSNLIASANYVLQTGDTSACTSTTTLAAGQSCTLAIAFSPATGASGTVTGSVVLTDNALNGTAATQTISLSGVAGVITVTTTTTVISPSSIVYGNAASATATIAGGTNPTGKVTFVSNGVTLGIVNLVSGMGSIPLGIPFAGSLAVTASYSGDSNNSSSSGVGNTIVQPAVLTVTAGNATKADAAVNPSFTYTITGFVNGDTSAVVSGTPSLTTTATTTSSAGAYDITPSLGTLSASNYTFAFVKGTLTVLPPDFKLSVSPTSLSAFASLQASTIVSITSSSYTGTVQLSCSNLPANVTCGFLSNTLTGNPAAANQTVSTTLNISTDVLAKNNVVPMSRQIENIVSALSIPFLSISFLFIKKRKRKLQNLLGLIVLLFIGMGISSCSSGPENHVALAGTSQITITAADSSGLSHSATVTLTIQ